MHIAVIAADGRLGRAFVQEALANGHSVRAGIREGVSFPDQKNLELVTCDATQVEDVRRLLQNQDVVVSAIGHVKDSPPDVQTEATKIVISVMKELGIVRFVDVTGTGVRFPGDKITVIDHILNLAVTIIDRARVQDGRDHQEVLKRSDISWTTIRVLKLQNVPPRAFTLTSHGPTKPYVGRQEVAKAMLQVIEDNTFVKEAPILSSYRL